MTTLDRKKAPSFKQVSNIQFLDVTKTNLDNGIEVNYINGGSQEIHLPIASDSIPLKLRRQKNSFAYHYQSR